MFLSHENEPDHEYLMDLIKGKHKVIEIESNSNLSSYEIYNGKLIICVFQGKFSPWNLNFNIIGGGIRNHCCETCSKTIETVLDIKLCVCGRKYCNKECIERDKHHFCIAKICTKCNKKFDLDRTYHLTIS